MERSMFDVIWETVECETQSDAKEAQAILNDILSSILCKCGGIKSVAEV